MAIEIDDTAQEILEVVPIAMRFLRGQMRKFSAADLSVPQFRALLFIKRHSGTSLGNVAAHLGLTAPSTSKLVDGLERRELVERKTSSSDRRKITLAITGIGTEMLDRAAKETRASISSVVSVLSAEELLSVQAGMAALKRCFSPTRAD